MKTTLEISKNVTIEFSADDDNIARWVKENGLDADALTDLEISFDVEIDEFDKEDLIEYAEQLIEEEAVYDQMATARMSTIERIYRTMAEGDMASAMQEFADAFEFLRPPATERQLSLLIAKGNASHV